jgi:ubiquinone/menaquinone biosynthesis C-methylase UbiE
MPATPINIEQAVKARYSRAAAAKEAALCCPVDYDNRYLKIIPQEILERDYGCGDPSKVLRPGERVLDLGSGGGKICYISSQIVGAMGKVIGVDINDEMLSLANRYREEIGNRLGYHNVTFHKGKIQDLALDYGKVERYLAEHPVQTLEGLEAFEAWKEEQRRSNPMIQTASVDVVLSNCVLNLVRPEDKTALFREMHRVLKRGGRAVISDIVSDEDVPAHLQVDPELWSGCISGAFREDLFFKTFEEASFYGIRVLKRDEKPWQTIEGIEFRAVTVEAYKGKEGPCLERYQAVIYKGPWRSVTDDDGHTLYRGQRMAVCDKTFHIYKAEPYRKDIELIEPYEEVPLAEAQPFDCGRDEVRHSRETKGIEYNVTQTTDAPYCAPDGNCC